MGIERMMNGIRTWIRLRYHEVLNSIAFFPAFIAVIFVFLAVSMIWFDLSGPGTGLKSKLGWMSLKDANAARTIISTIAAGIITLTVFSFSMVMIVLNQAASQLSNRVLDQLIGNRFQQVVLGIYIGTIVYSLFLLTTIREGDTGVSLPVLSTYLLILIGVFDIFLFIYFLHYITQSVKYELIIKNIQKETMDAMEQKCHLTMDPGDPAMPEMPFVVEVHSAGIFEDYDKRSVLRFCEKNDLRIGFSHVSGTFLLKGSPLLRSDRPLTEELQKEIRDLVPLVRIGSVENNFTQGMRQLTEVAMKSLSPGINDPGTAMLSLRALFELFAYRLEHFPDPFIRDKDGTIRITERVWPFEDLFEGTILPIWDYGKNDRSIQHELHGMLAQLRTNHAVVKKLQLVVRKKLEEHHMED